MADTPAVEMWTIVDVNTAPEKNGSGRIKQYSVKALMVYYKLW